MIMAKENNLLNYFYTIEEIAIALNFNEEEQGIVSYYSKTKKIDNLYEEVPKLAKFKPYIRTIYIDKKMIYVISAITFDLYIKTGLLPDRGTDVKEPDKNKREYWQYNSANTYELCTKDEWGFALDYFQSKDANITEDDIWNIFLAGCARIDYTQGSTTTISQRIKYAIMEYMLKRPQFFNTSDFVEGTLE